MPFKWGVRDGQACLSGDDFKKLGFNMSELLRYIRQQNSVIEFYENADLD